MIKNLCAVCGIEIKPNDDFCSDCQQAREKARKATAGISRAAENIISSLDKKGEELITQTNLFRSQLMADISKLIKDFETKVRADLEEHATRLMNDYFNSLEERRKEVKSVGE